jgi:predicted transcriptional regulator
MKVSRTIRLDKELSDKLDGVCTRHGDVTWHIENALKHYLGSYQTEPKKESINASK